MAPVFPLMVLFATDTPPPSGPAQSRTSRGRRRFPPAASVAPHIQEGDVVVGLPDAPWGALARHAERLAGHDRVVLVGPHVELDDLVPMLGLVHRTAELAES